MSRLPISRRRNPVDADGHDPSTARNAELIGLDISDHEVDYLPVDLGDLAEVRASSYRPARRSGNPACRARIRLLLTADQIHQSDDRLIAGVSRSHRPGQGFRLHDRPPSPSIHRSIHSIDPSTIRLTIRLTIHPAIHSMIHPPALAGRHPAAGGGATVILQRSREQSARRSPVENDLRSRSACRMSFSSVLSFMWDTVARACVSVGMKTFSGNASPSVNDSAQL
jgi:hypothetical protein